MANIKIPRKEFENQVSKLDKAMQHQIAMFGTTLESITQDQIELEIFPNRPDLLSFQGFMRAFKAFIGKETGLKKYKIIPPSSKDKVIIKPEVKKVRPFTACAIVKGLKFDDEKIKEIIDLQEKLHSTIGRNRKKAAIGIYPLEKITLPITYTAKKPNDIKFIPLESESSRSFSGLSDAQSVPQTKSNTLTTNKEMTGAEILRRHPTGRDYAHLLENQDKYPIFIDAKNKILSMPPIINSHDTGKITEQTKDVFIECSGFHFETLNKILNIIVTTLADMGGKIQAMTLQDKQKSITPNLSTEKMQISLENTNKRIGLNLKEPDLAKLLPRMGYNYKNKIVEIPAWRTDILHEVDLIEDVAIAFGYDKLIPKIPAVSRTQSNTKDSRVLEHTQESKTFQKKILGVATIAEQDPLNNIKSAISNTLAGLGLIETSTFHLIKPQEAKLMKLSKDELIELESSKTDYKILRPSLLIPTLRVLSENKDNEYPQKIFEIGTIFPCKDEKAETGICETENLIITLTPSNFTQAKQVLDNLFQSLNLTYTLEETQTPYTIDGRTGTILLDKQPIGYIGEVSPLTLRAWNIKLPVAVIEIELDEIFEKLRGH